MVGYVVSLEVWFDKHHCRCGRWPLGKGALYPITYALTICTACYCVDCNRQAEFQEITIKTMDYRSIIFCLTRKREPQSFTIKLHTYTSCQNSDAVSDFKQLSNNSPAVFVNWNYTSGLLNNHTLVYWCNGSLIDTYQLFPAKKWIFETTKGQQLLFYIIIVVCIIVSQLELWSPVNCIPL